MEEKNPITISVDINNLKIIRNELYSINQAIIGANLTHEI